MTGGACNGVVERVTRHAQGSLAQRTVDRCRRLTVGLGAHDHGLDGLVGHDGRDVRGQHDGQRLFSHGVRGVVRGRQGGNQGGCIHCRDYRRWDLHCCDRHCRWLLKEDVPVLAESPVTVTKTRSHAN